jgi:RIO kinase 1
MHSLNQSNKKHWQDDEDLKAYYEETFNLPRSEDRSRPRPPKNAHQKAAELRSQIEAVADDAGLSAGFDTTYRPTRFESEWLHESLTSFFERDLITDVMARVQGGKEANVYRCKAHPSLGIEWLAAKVYRPRKFRNLRNDAMYREGRRILAEDNGQVKKVKATDDRILRAVDKKTTFGAQVQHTSWLMYEYTTLQTLHKAGAAVPKPVSAAENAILMSYVGDAQRAAPTLHETHLTLAEVEPLFKETLRNVELMLQKGVIHGDLSAYNILYWQGEITLIDFPQVTDAKVNRNAYKILHRDVQRICEYFERYGLRSNEEQIVDEFWQGYAAPDPQDQLADWSAMAPQEEEL